MDAIASAITRAGHAFVALLRTPMQLGVQMTEESLRDTFCAALRDEGVAPEHIVLEAKGAPEGIPEARLNLSIRGPAQETQAAIAFKYDQDVGRLKAEQAGNIFADLARLLRWDEAQARYFIYMADRSLHHYLRGQPSPLSDIFFAPNERTFDLDAGSFARLRPLFRKGMKEWPEPALLRVVMSYPLPYNHWVWIFSIAPKMIGSGIVTAITQETSLIEGLTDKE